MNRIQEEFSYLSNEDVEILSKYSSIVDYDKETIIIEYGKYEPYFYYVLEGIVRGYGFTNEGDEHNMFFIHHGQYFISPEKFFNKERKNSNHVFETVNKVVALKIHHNRLMELAMENHSIFEFYHDALKVLLQSFLERIRLMSIENAEERYLHLITTRPVLEPNVQKKHIAQFLGITPNSFSRILRSLKQK